MKKSTMIALVNYLANVPEMHDIYEELNTELLHENQKSANNRALYDAAKPIVLAALAIQTAPITVADLYAECENELPEKFTKSKLQYALNNYWIDAITKVETPVYEPKAYMLKGD